MARSDEFARAVVGSNLRKYAQRGQTNERTIIKQIATGKLAELAVYYYLKEQGLVVDAVDFKIYPSRKKSYSADITGLTHNYHVKAQSAESAKNYGISWSYSVGDPLLTKPEHNDIVVNCIVLTPNRVKICGLMTAEDMIPHLALPKLSYLQYSKRVIYEKDVKFLAEKPIIQMLLDAQTAHFEELEKCSSL